LRNAFFQWGKGEGENFLKFGGTFVFGEKFHPNAALKEKEKGISCCNILNFHKKKLKKFHHIWNLTLVWYHLLIF
jgi:hypothetical protein